MRKQMNWLLVGLLLASFLAGCGPALTKEVKVLNPVGEPAVPIIPSAPRLDTLEGKRIGLYIIRRANAFELMDRIAENLANQFPTAEILTHKTNKVWAKPSYDRTASEQGIFDEILAEKPDAIIIGLGS